MSYGRFPFKQKCLGGTSPGLVVMGDNSFLRGCGLKSQRRILDGHFFTLICCKNSIVRLKIPKINKKRPGLVHFKHCNNLHLLYNSLEK